MNPSMLHYAQKTKEYRSKPEDVGMKLIKQLYEKTHFVDHLIDSYNDFITRGIQTIVNRDNTIVSPSCTLQFGHVYIDTPKFVNSNRSVSLMFPNDARKRNINYEGTIFVTLRVIVGSKIITHNQVAIGKLPVMLHSNACNLNKTNKIDNYECSNDYGGYFIIKGKERTLISQMRRAYNKVYVENVEGQYLAEMRTVNDYGMSVLIRIKFNHTLNEISISPPKIKLKHFLPAGLFFKALGISEKNMIRYCRIDNNDVIQTLKNQYDICETPEMAIRYISSSLQEITKDVFKDDDYVKNILENEIFYHLHKPSKENVAIHTGYIIKKLIDTVFKNRAQDDKENISNKRLDCTSSLLTFLFQAVFKQYIKGLSIQMEKISPDPINIIKQLKLITQNLNYSFLTGNWNIQKSMLYTRLGVSQVLSVQNYGAKLSHLRRISSPNSNKGTNTSLRYLHSSHFSFICPFETPEGETVGIVLNLALSATISTEIDAGLVECVVSKIKSFKNDVFGIFLILINGKIIGSTNHIISFKEEFIQYRNSDMLDNNVSFIYLSDESEIHIQTDEGRVMRPVFAIGDNNEILHHQYPNASWDTHIEKHTIVFRDAWELEQSVVAMTEDDLKKHKCNYLEICPAATMMGIMASVIPLSNHSQSPRNAYQAAMGKQAIGIPTEAFQYRFDTTLNILNSPAKPLSASKLVSVLGFDKMSHGHNPIVAIMTYRGFNQEDSIILNKSSLDRGLFAATTYKTIVEEEKKRGTCDFETICLPKFEYRNTNYDYSFLNEQGIVYKKNVFLKKNTVIIGRTTHKKTKNDEGLRVDEMYDTSVCIKCGEEGFLESVLDTTTNEGIRVLKIKIQIFRRVEIGDKFASSTAQKGTCGMVYSQEDLPFTSEGIVPDLIINPHAIPSRMTINMLIEMAFNLVGCKLGLSLDTTPFQHYNVEKELENWAKLAGIDNYSTKMMDGTTGQHLPARIFIAPCFYQRLKHMVEDKIHARVAGPLDTLTHQPVAGRSKDGGFRFGEMERDCILVHGSTRVLKECLFDKSDKYTIPVCAECGVVPDRYTYCLKCKDSVIEIKNMPYATKLLCQELQAMGIKIKIK
jgi:DNA-directed RNA polymerase beta subunit